MTIQTRKVEYSHGESVLEGHMAWDDSLTVPLPAVLVCHAFRGQEDFERDKAQRLAELGYVGFAIDLYGKGVAVETKEEAFALMAPFLEDRLMLRERLLACVEAAGSQAEVNADALAAIGYCFGGMCALDLARANAPLLGVASFHGLLRTVEEIGADRIDARVLALHGWDDPMVPPEQVLQFTEEMTAAGADWQLHGYGGTVHAFTNPGANDPDFGTVYNADADRRSWQNLELFLNELF